MSTESTNATTNAQRPVLFRVFCLGQIATKSKLIKSSVGPNYYITLLTTPAPDQFSSPGTVTIRSSAPIGDPGESWQGWGTLGGYKRTIPARTNPETGEMRAAVSVADMYVLAAE